ncbi:MAG: hypothetical protein QNJ74_26655 [Trichodesmium sp. MO_231.B1]|nr:hypothetical protein [Trichodesmium sp. MO_231.B1]
MTNPPNPDPNNPRNPDPNNLRNQQNRNLFQRFIQSIRRNSTLILVATLGGFMTNIIGFTVDFVEFQGLLYPERDTSNYKSGWVLAKITGYSVTSYDFAEQHGTGGLKAFFVQRLKGTSQLTSMIYTDYQPTDSYLNDGDSPENDISVLKNVDYEGKFPTSAKDKKSKRNSQTFQARLIQASRNKEPVCLFVYGIRDNDKSQFLNILKFKTIDQKDQDDYNTLIKEENPQKKQKKLVELTGDVCPGKTLF